MNITSLTEGNHRVEIACGAHVYFIKHMAQAMGRDGSIIVISSMSGTCVTDGTVFPYSCAKAATNCLVQCAAIEFGPRNIRVNARLRDGTQPAGERRHVPVEISHPVGATGRRGGLPETTRLKEY
jgi:short-subunit dehydrogenase